MELLDRYVYHVGQNLPARQRADIEAEIRSLLEDTLEARSRAEGRPADPGMAAEVLRQFGPPEKMAASYLPERYLVGPRLYPTFTLVLRIVLAVIAALALFAFGLRLSQQAGLAPADFPRLITQALADLFSAAVQTLGSLVIVFFILERALPAAGPGKAAAWDPFSLKPAGDTSRVSPAGVIVEMLFAAAAIALFSLRPDWFARVVYHDGAGWVSLPLLGENFYRFVPALTVLWVLTIVQGLVLLRRGVWQTGTRLFALALNLGALALLALLLLGGPLVSVPAAAFPDAQTAARLAEGAGVGLKIGLMVAFVATLFDAGGKLYNLVTRRAA